MSKTNINDIAAEIIRPAALPIITCLSKTTIWRLERIGKFPRRLRLSPGAVGYRRTDIESWLASREEVK
ncbi:MAG: hypothetical protein CVU71_06585 [Deltaproteobacteria bacterium HGW-Deltaproteobacteria-6]|jgi:prophage regulatory protein|nr:MAG: hypothetical protein CVU71_06585 [Deltaproteobacteria bacterium HGW-Deltaproteobacteria-6]